ncbi:MAG: sulfide-dependent adenosine diphosphate thiazole synthase [Candidatus Cloacimonetes bacterium]|nr:sulfide-dependent adenosine diphosphate thiazole synthase [Candidatus Cloacimonadota bacterium]MBS3766623.1 sulfide-dependent adenosine diphosphate thiazole synthase [Candidatus Cloacimonadota bacterium]
MKLNEEKVTRAILSRYTEKFLDNLDQDVIIAGAGPAGLTLAYYLAKAGINVSIFEKKLSIGGGMWGGGMLFNEIVVQDMGKEVLDELGVRTRPFEEGYYTADSVEAVTTICSNAINAGAQVFNAILVEDVMIEGEGVCGVVVNWTSVEKAGLHVDPLSVRAKIVVEATGHPLEVLKIIEKKVDADLYTSTGKIIGERSMNAEMGEKTVVENSKEIFKNVYVVGMAANAAFGAHRMGPIFGGMILSGKELAEKIIRKLQSQT